MMRAMVEEYEEGYEQDGYGEDGFEDEYEDEYDDEGYEDEYDDEGYDEGVKWFKFFFIALISSVVYLMKLYHYHSRSLVCQAIFHQWARTSLQCVQMMLYATVRSPFNSTTITLLGNSMLKTPEIS